MRIDPFAANHMIAIVKDHKPRAPWRRLVKEAMRLAGDHSALVSHCEKAWASVTFSGARHTITLSFSGNDGMDAADDYIEALPDHEFTIAGWIVADAMILSVDQRVLPEPLTTVEAEFLLLEDR